MRINNIFRLEEIPLDTASIPQSLLNIERKERSNPFAWNGQFSPQFIQVLIQKYASRDTIILDPFVGSGTVLYEAGKENLQAFGIEINPAAYILARTYRFINVKHKERAFYIEKIDTILKDVVPTNLPLLEGVNYSKNAEEIKSTLINLHKELQPSISKDFLETLIVKLDFHKDDLTDFRLFKTWNSLKKFVMELPFSDKTLEIINCDARCLPIRDNSIDLVITSPPYINVHNYHQMYRASAEALGWDVLSVAKSEIGSNRKHRGNRFLTVIQYCLDIAQALCEIKRVCRESSRVIFIVGRESKIRDVRFYNGQIVALLGMRSAGFNIETRQERVFKNKFGTLIYEDILHFIVSKKESKDSLYDARNIAKEVLEYAAEIAPVRSRGEIQDALKHISDLQPSPLYKFKVENLNE